MTDSNGSDKRMTDILGLEHYPTTSDQVAHSLNNDNTPTPYQFFTDGSLSNLGTNNIRLGYGWLQLTDNDLIVSEHCNAISSTWPSSTKAELSAILSIIEQLPSGAKVTISLDSQLVIDNIRSIIHTVDRFDKYLLKLPNHHLWAKLRHLIKDNNIILTLIKVKAHSDDDLNNRADVLAKRGALLSLPPIPQDTYSSFIPFKITWNNTLPIDTNLRHFIKDVQHARLHQDFISMNRFTNHSSYSDPIDWVFTWSVLQFSMLASKNGTNFKDNNFFVFRYKLLFDELPTMRSE